MAARLGRLGEPGTSDEDVVTRARHLVSELLPDRAKLPLEPVALDRAPDRSWDREPEPRLTVVLTREPVQRQQAGRRRPALPVHGIEVPRARQAVPSLHGADGLRRQPLAALVAATLDDRPAATRGHAVAEPVLPLPATDVGLIGALHGWMLSSENAPSARSRAATRRRSIDEALRLPVFHSSAWVLWQGNRCTCGSLVAETDRSARAFHSCGDLCGKSQNAWKSACS